MKIIGAGLSGLIAAHAFPKAAIVESAPAPFSSHKALLRFRSESVSHMTHIPFKKVTVRKGIWHDGNFVQPTIALANQYARKVTRTVSGDRSIWDISTVERYIAPEDFYQRMVEQVGDRIQWNCQYDFSKIDDVPVISTAPLHVTLAACGIDAAEQFQRSSIVVKQFRLTNVDVYQTIYFPNPATHLYRASITGDLLICEFVKEPHEDDTWQAQIRAAFSIGIGEPIGEVKQRYGKIVALENEKFRRRSIAALSQERNIYSLGRFATWRNILLDDVVKDLSVIRDLIDSDDSYALRLKRFTKM